MGNERSIASKSSGAAKAEQVSANSKGAVGHRQINMQMMQNVLVIWLDNNINDNSVDCRNTITQLRCIMNTINIFTDGEECIQFLEDMQNYKVCMIISGALGQHIVPRIHNMSQVDSIFVFCGNKTYHEQWAKEWFKIKGVFTEIVPIGEGLKQAVQQCEQNAMPISFMVTSDDISKKNLDQLEPSFMYTQILKEILLTIKFEQQHIKEFIDHCREALADNEDELKNIKSFEQKYHDKTPIWWYTCECFLHPMLNRALRLMDVDIIIKMGFFIGDLHRHIEQLHKKQFGDGNSHKSFTVYRGQGMSKADFEQLTKTKGGLVSFNNFLSTSKKRDLSLGFANGAVTNSGLVGILFVMTIDPSKSTTPFASITDVSYFKEEEDEVLFAMHTVFRIHDITPMDENYRLFRVELILTSDNDKDLRILTDRIREDSFPNSIGWYRLGSVLFKMGQSAKAQQVYEMLLKQTTQESGKAPIYGQLGLTTNKQGEYKEAITFYEKALEIKEKTLPPNHHSLAASYNNIGMVYAEMGEYSKALSYYEKALEIQQQSLPPNHPSLGSSYNNIGIVYRKMGEYSKALWYYEKDLEISQKSLPPNDPDLAMCHGNIGNVYDSIGEYSKALSSHETALAIQQQSLPPDHPSLGSSYNNIGAVYDKMGNYLKARSFYERAVDIGQRSLPPNHPTLQQRQKNLDRVNKKL